MEINDSTSNKYLTQCKELFKAAMLNTDAAKSIDKIYNQLKKQKNLNLTEFDQIFKDALPLLENDFTLSGKAQVDEIRTKIDIAWSKQKKGVALTKEENVLLSKTEKFKEIHRHRKKKTVFYTALISWLLNQLLLRFLGININPLALLGIDIPTIIPFL